MKQHADRTQCLDRFVCIWRAPAWPHLQVFLNGDKSWHGFQEDDEVIGLEAGQAWDRQMRKVPQGFGQQPKVAEQGTDMPEAGRVSAKECLYTVQVVFEVLPFGTSPGSSVIEWYSRSAPGLSGRSASI